MDIDDELMLTADWIERLRIGDEQAATAIFQRYVRRLTALARVRISEKFFRRFDAEDVVMSVFRSFFVAMDKGTLRFSQRGDLWSLLVVMTLRKLRRRIRFETAEKRSISSEVSSFESGRAKVTGASLSGIVETAPSPDEMAIFADELELILKRLPARRRPVFEARLAGFSKRQIAERLGCSERTVRRTLRGIEAELVEQIDRDQVVARPLNRSALKPMGTQQHAVCAKAGNRAISDCSEHANDYLIRRMIGAGRSSRVYLATRKRDGAKVALKFPRKSLQHDIAARERFESESATLACLSHSGIAKFHGLGQTRNGQLFFTTDFLDGENLQALQRANAIAPLQATRWMIRICEAIEYLHEKAIIHCDIKPANIVRCDNGRLVVVDFGLARPSGRDSWETFRMEGTAPFMAPEQASAWWGEVAVETDVYGLGATFFTLLTNRPPFVGSSVAEIVGQVVARDCDSWRPILAQFGELPVAEICSRCLEKSPGDRISSVSELRQALQQAAILMAPSAGLR